MMSTASGSLAGGNQQTTTDTDTASDVSTTENTEHMTRTTDYHGWTIPTEDGDVNQWDSILSDLLDGPLEASVALRGPLSERPAVAPTDAVYHATDRDEFFRYDGNLSQWVPALAHIDEARERHDGMQGPLAVYQQLGSQSLGELRHTQQTVGTRRMACQWPLVGGRGPGNFTYRNDGVNERVNIVRYGFVEQPPNMVPILRAMPTISSDTAGETFRVGVRLRSQLSGEWLMTFEAGPDTDTHTLYDEVRLNEVPYGSAARGPNTLENTAIEVHAAIDGTPTAGTIVGGSALALDWEVV